MNSAKCSNSHSVVPLAASLDAAVDAPLGWFQSHVVARAFLAAAPPPPGGDFRIPLPRPADVAVAPPRAPASFDLPWVYVIEVV